MPAGEHTDAIAGSLYAVAAQLQRLGTGTASTDKGAIEILAESVKEGSERIAMAIEDLADAVRGHKA